MHIDPAVYNVKPCVLERECGGWLAITPRGWPLSIGVVADTEIAVRQVFDEALARWAKIGRDVDKEERTGLSERL